MTAYDRDRLIYVAARAVRNPTIPPKEPKVARYQPPNPIERPTLGPQREDETEHAAVEAFRKRWRADRSDQLAKMVEIPENATVHPGWTDLDFWRDVAKKARE